MGAILAAGWYKGKMGFDGLANTRNHYGDRTAFLAQMAVRYEDGREEIFVTDTSWTGEDAPVIFAEIYDGEVYECPKRDSGMGRTGKQWGKLESSFSS